MVHKSKKAQGYKEECIDLHSFPDNFTPIALCDDLRINSK